MTKIIYIYRIYLHLVNFFPKVQKANFGLTVRKTFNPNFGPSIIIGLSSNFINEFFPSISPYVFGVHLNNSGLESFLVKFKFFFYKILFYYFFFVAVAAGGESFWYFRRK